MSRTYVRTGLSSNISMGLPQNAQTHFPILVEVGVESDHTSSCGHKLDPGGLEGVVGGESEYKVEKSPFIWSVEWTSNDGIHLCIVKKKKHACGSQSSNMRIIHVHNVYETSKSFKKGQ